MSDHRTPEEEVQRAVLVIAAFVFVPILVLAVLFWITQTLGPWLWVVVLGGVAAATLYVFQRFKQSAPVVRSDRESELLERVAQAERQ